MDAKALALTGYRGRRARTAEGKRVRRLLRRVVPDPVERTDLERAGEQRPVTGRVVGAEAVGDRVEHDRRHRDHRPLRKARLDGVVAWVAGGRLAAMRYEWITTSM